VSSWDSNWQPGRGDGQNWHPAQGFRRAGHEGRHAVTNIATSLAVLASLGSGLSLLAWGEDSGKQVPCPPSGATMFNIQSIGLVASTLLLLAGLVLLAASLWQKMRGVVIGWVLMIAALLIGVASCGLLMAAVTFHHGNDSSCLNF